MSRDETERHVPGERALPFAPSAARLLATALGCRVDCLEMSTDFCAGAVQLNRLTRLDDRIGVHKGSAPDVPFPDVSFDVVWMQNVGVNIADKRTLGKARVTRR